MAYIFGHPEIKQVGTEGKGPLMEGKRVMVTGASSGIGYGIAERALQRGAAEVWICSRNEGRIKAAADKLNAQYGRVRWAAIDVVDADALNKFADEMAAGGPIDFLFATAGVNVLRPFEVFDRETFDMVMGPNVYGVYNADKAGAPDAAKDDVKEHQQGHTGGADGDAQVGEKNCHDGGA